MSGYNLVIKSNQLTYNVPTGLEIRRFSLLFYQYSVPLGLSL